jgi:hypothetical protein
MTQQQNRGSTTDGKDQLLPAFSMDQTGDGDERGHDVSRVGLQVGEHADCFNGQCHNSPCGLFKANDCKPEGWRVSLIRLLSDRVFIAAFFAAVGFYLGVDQSFRALSEIDFSSICSTAPAVPGN